MNRFEVERRCQEHSKKIKLEQFDPTEMKAGGNVLTVKEDCEVRKEADDDLPKKMEGNFFSETEALKAVERDEGGNLWKVEENLSKASKVKASDHDMIHDQQL